MAVSPVQKAPPALMAETTGLRAPAATSGASHCSGRIATMRLKDLAEHLGLSQTTVSRALNGYPEVKEATRVRVAEAAAELGYRPNASALRLATGRAGAVGLVLRGADELGPHMSEFLSGLSGRMVAQDIDIVVTTVASHQEELAAYRRLAASQRVDAGDPFLRHKTTRRTIYERAFAEATAQGCDDALLLNRQGFITETSRSNIFIECDGVLLTPPLEHGLLPGVLRRELIETGAAREAPLRLDDLRQAGRCYVGNSLRGLQIAELAGSSLASGRVDQK